MKNRVVPDELASEKPADLDLHCFENGISCTDPGIFARGGPDPLSPPLDPHLDMSVFSMVSVM